MTKHKGRATIYPILPEPCDECESGLAKIQSYDGVDRCGKCALAHAEVNGWLDEPTPDEIISPANSDPVDVYEQPRIFE